jgi:hypothetical protein
MNDDFLKRHRRQPDPKFVERLAYNLNTNPQRSNPMSKRILRPALIVIAVLVLSAALTLALSPTARAAVLAIFNFNGVTVSVDDETGKLVTSGNTDAIIEQGDNYVAIQGEDGSSAGIVVASNLVDVEEVAATDLLNRFPDLKLPNVPQGYTMNPKGLLFGDGSLTITWTDEAGHTITYSRNTNSPQEFSIADPSGNGNLVPLPESELQEGSEVSSNAGILPAGTSTSGEGQIGSNMMVGPDGVEAQSVTTHAWEADGYYHQLLSTDQSLTEADLQEMQP